MRRLVVAIVSVLIAAHAFAGETENLVAIARIWAAAKYLDPAIESNEVDWDAAVISAMPKARAAKSDEDLARAVDGMLASLHDPATHIVKEEHHTAAGSGDVALFRLDGDVLVINAAPYVAAHGEASVYPASQKLMPELAKSKAVVIDLRAGEERNVAEDAAGILFNIPVATDDVAAPSRRYTFHSGYAPQSGATSGGYYSGFTTIAGRPLRASHNGAPARWVFVTDASSELSGEMLAVWSAGTAAIVSSVPISDTAASLTKVYPIAGRWSAQIRIAQLEAPLAADVVDPDPLAVAMAIARGEKPIPSHAVTGSLPAAGRWKLEAPYAASPYPDTEHRILGAFRLWAVIHYFYPYLPLIGDWDAAFAEAIPQFIAAKDAAEYAKAAMAFDAHVEDGHSGVYGPAVYEAIPFGFIPIAVKYVGSDLAVIDPMDVAGLHKGDVIVGINGEPIADRVARLRPFVTASTAAARADRIAAVALRGKPKEASTIEVRDASGTRSVTVTNAATPPRPESKEPAYRSLDGNIGYADLTRLEVVDVDKMFDVFANTKAIVLDMRGYPHGTAWAIAPHINTRHAKVGATFRRRQITGAETSEESAAGFFFEQLLPVADKPLYRGKVVVLIDDRAISQSEHSCLFFEAANGATFIGSTTAGANGDVTSFPLPGGLTVFFTGHDVRHADGRQLQRVGIQPDVPVEPTLAGIRAGRDEVLERAVAFINSGH